jgi:hypothetical protein
MKRKILLIFLVIVIVSQVPFAYRRYRLSRLNKTIRQLASQRISQPTEDGYIDYRGVIHVHTALGGHSTGAFAELISAAKTNQLDFVIMTEHPQSEFDTSAMTLSGPHAGVLFVNGNEVATSNGDRLLLIPGSSSAASMSTQSTPEIIEKQKAAGGLALVAYPAESENWQSTAIDGVEIYNLFTNARTYNALIGFFDGLWSYGSYPDLMFANFFARPTENLSRWDQALADRHRNLVAIAGNDAHSNIGINLNDASGKQWLGIKLDPYERSFRTVRTHVLIPRDKELSRESLLEAISQGHCYVAFDLFGDPKGFSFAVAAAQQKIMGDEIAFAEGLRLTAGAPLVSRFVLVKDGRAIEQKSGVAAEFSISASGSYRLEVYLDSLPSPAKGQPWILSNPIYIR